MDNDTTADTTALAKANPEEELLARLSASGRFTEPQLEYLNQLRLTGYPFRAAKAAGVSHDSVTAWLKNGEFAVAVRDLRAAERARVSLVQADLDEIITKSEAVETLADLLRTIAPQVAALPPTYDRTAAPTHTAKDVTAVVAEIGALRGWHDWERDRGQKQALSVTINLGEPEPAKPVALPP